MTDNTVKLADPAKWVWDAIQDPREQAVGIAEAMRAYATAAVMADRAERTAKVDPVRSRMIPMHYAENIWYAATILEKSESIIDKREAKVLRELAWLLGVQEMA